MSSGFYLTSSVIYFNMSAQIMFILASRMKAQNIDMNTVGSKIMCDITLLMYKPSFIDSIIEPQLPISISTFYEIFNKVVNCSHMKLDKSSMQKLFFLILMTFKKQVFLISSPLQFYTLTLTHLEDAISIQKGNSQSVECIQQAIQKFKHKSNKWTYMQYLQIKEEILSTLQTYKSKIMLFCETGAQDSNGNIIFKPRNTHNRKEVGLCQNHQNIEFVLPKSWSSTKNLQYSQYKNWKTVLGKDDYDNARGSSKALQSRVKQQDDASYSKQISEMLGIKHMKLDNFQLHLDIFGSNPQPVKFDGQIQKNKNIQKAKTVEAKQVSDIKKKIESQFENLSMEVKQSSDDVDLLELMDS